MRTRCIPIAPAYSALGFRGGLISLAALLLLGKTPLYGASFDEQRTTIAASIESQPEEAILSLITAGIAENRPAPAIVLASEWLRRNLPKSPALLFQAARAAELSGEPKNAVSFHQQALKLADPKSAEAGESIIAVHTLLIYRLQDTASAYVFSQNEAERLSVNPSFRQFDQWFLSEAIKRNDPTAVAKRLNTCITAGIPADLLNTRYSQYFLWLLDSVDGYCDQPGKAPLSQDLYDAIKDLCGVMTHSDEMKLRFDWAVSIKAYNLAKLGNQVAGKIGVRRAGNKQPGKKSSDAPVVEEKKLEMGNDTSPPLAEASALLGKFPQYAMWVMTGWAGGGNGQYYRGDFKKYWPHEADAKMAAILSALSKLPPAEAAEVLYAAAYGGYVATPGISELKSVQDYLKANPATLNSHNGVVVLDKEWHKLTPEEAQKLAPSLAQINIPQASLVRAIAAGGKDYDKVTAALLGPEAWRLGPAELNGTYTDSLWLHCGRPGGNQKRDEAINKSKAVAATLAAADAKKEDPADKRIAAFRNLWADYKSPQPKNPAARSRLTTVLKFTPEVVPELLKDPNLEALGIVRDAIAAGIEDAKGPIERDTRIRGISFSSYSPWIQRLASANGGMDQMKQQKKDFYAPHPLEPALRAAVSERLAQGKIEPWLTMAWINMQFPENNAEQIKIMQALFKSPAWAGVPFQLQYAAREWFKKDAMTPGQITWVDASNPDLLCADLLTLPKEADAATATAALTKAIEGIRKSPVFLEIQGLEKLVAISDTAFADEKLHMLCVQLISKRLIIEPTPLFATRLFAALTKRNDPADLLCTSGYLWRHVALNNRTFPAMLALAESSLEKNPSVSYVFANDGLGTIERHSTGHAWFKTDTDIPHLKSIRGKAAGKLGLIVIPVAPTHPAYPIYQAQAEWMSGNEDSTWKLLDANWESFTTTHRELSIPFLMWTLQRTIFSRDDARQEFLVKSLIAWAGEANSPLTPTEKATIELAYGDIALQRGQVRQAHEIYTRTRQNPTYAELPIRHEASLRRVRAERIAKNYDAALQTLTDLEMERVPEIWTDVRFARAEVYFDREDFDDAKDDVDSILARDTNHADSRILLGKIQLKRQKLMEATEVELAGSTTSQKTIVPGERLKVTLSDPTLAVSGAGTEIEVVVWADSGDKETFFLRQFGDSKTKFRGEVATALGAAASGDGTLQVIGDDQVFYAYSKRFREKMNNLDEKRGGPITIASDAMLMASARKLLTEVEQRAADMQLIMDEIGGGANSEAAAKARIAAGEADINHARHIATIVKPGNPIHVRVIDPDRSRTPGIDELAVNVSSSSGDSVSRVTLRETGAYTGVFEGRVPTAGAQANAFAQNSEPGRTPNMVISPSMAYPAWRPVPTKGTIPEFTVDFNDNLPLGELTITAREPSAKLGKFIVQTAMDPTDWTSVATFPSTAVSLADPLKPSITVVNEDARNHQYGARSVYEIEALRSHLATGWLAHQPGMAIAKNVTGPSTALPGSIPTDIKWTRSGTYPNPAVVVRFQAYFHEKENVHRHFSLDLGNIPSSQKIAADKNQQAQPAEFLIAVNGRVITTKGQLQGEIDLKPGIQKIEIWGTGWLSNIGFGREVKLRANLTSPESLTDCPNSLFDPATFPPALVDHHNGPANIIANADSTEFRVKFDKDSRARFIRLIMVGYEGTAPALNKLALKKPDGSNILPVANDFAELNKNDTLEILTGDKISVRYVDDRFVTKSRERQERFLEVSFTDARIEFADMEPRFDQRRNEDMPYYEKLLRFVHGKPLSLAIHDADMDSTVAPDKVKVSLESSTGTKEFDAIETGDSTGIFKLVVKPVSGATKNADEIQVPDGGVITARYIDKENNRPGVATPRVVTIRHAAYTEPQIILSHATVTPIKGQGAPATLHHGFEQITNEHPNSSSETIRPSWNINQTMLPTTKAPDGGFNAVLGQRMFIEIIAPQMALGETSKIDVFAQTDDGRRTAGRAADGFDKNVPGTLLLESGLNPRNGISNLWRQVPFMPIYQANEAPVFGENPESDRFFVTVPLILGTLPAEGALTEAERYELAKASQNSMDGADKFKFSPDGLVVRPGENVHIGFRYTAPDGSQKWATASAKVITHPAFDLMAEDYRATMTAAYVGENLNLRVVDLGADTSDVPNTVSVLVQAKSGAKHTLELLESGPHTGIFKASYQLSYIDAKPAPNQPEGGSESAPYDVRANGFPVQYGDTIAARYTGANGIKTETRMITISKGADGHIEPFSKKYDDPEIAMRTQFSLAEAYLEIAKRRRKLGENELADLDYQSAKQLLSSAMDQFNDASTRAHAEYLLGSLTMEEADATKDPETRETRYRAALSRFINVTGSYSET
ncbi:MAG: hypothetical protein WCS43_04380, partial [Verrucomicrobiota bacterium]